MMTRNILTPDLKSIAVGQDAKIQTDLSIQWVEDARGKSALLVQPTKTDFAVDDEWKHLVSCQDHDRTT